LTSIFIKTKEGCAEVDYGSCVQKVHFQRLTPNSECRL